MLLNCSTKITDAVCIARNEMNPLTLSVAPAQYFYKILNRINSQTIEESLFIECPVIGKYIFKNNASQLC